MHHLITGGAGFLGQLVARKLMEQGETATILDVWESEFKHPSLQFMKASVCDEDAVKKAMQGVNVVHHLAALVPLTKSGKNFEKVHVGGTAVVAEAAVREGVQYFIHVSTSAVYGVPKDFPITEKSPMGPMEAYGKSKVAGEQKVQEICDRGKLPLIIIRPRTIVGPERLGIFQILFDWIQTSKKIYILGDGSNKIQFVHAGDLIDFYMLALEKKVPGTYNVGTDRFGTLREDLEALIQHAGSESKVVGLPAGLISKTLEVLDYLQLSPLAPWHYKTYHKNFYFDTAPLKALGWTPQYSNIEMLIETYDDFIKNSSHKKQDLNRSTHRKPVKEKILKIIKAIS